MASYSASTKPRLTVAAGRSRFSRSSAGLPSVVEMRPIEKLSLSVTNQSSQKRSKRALASCGTRPCAPSTSGVNEVSPKRLKATRRARKRSWGVGSAWMARRTRWVHCSVFLRVTCLRVPSGLREPSIASPS